MDVPKTRRDSSKRVSHSNCIDCRTRLLPTVYFTLLHKLGSELNTLIYFKFVIAFVLNKINGHNIIV